MKLTARLHTKWQTNKLSNELKAAYYILCSGHRSGDFLSSNLSRLSRDWSRSAENIQKTTGRMGCTNCSTVYQHHASAALVTKHLVPFVIRQMASPVVSFQREWTSSVQPTEATNSIPKQKWKNWPIKYTSERFLGDFWLFFSLFMSDYFWIFNQLSYKKDKPLKSFEPRPWLCYKTALMQSNLQNASEQRRNSKILMMALVLLPRDDNTKNILGYISSHSKKLKY